MSIKLENVSYRYMQGTSLERLALNNINLNIDEGSFTAIAGQTGAGKSTLMQHMAGLLEPTTGTVTVGNINLYPKSKKDRISARTARFRIGMVFQYPEHQLFGETVYEDIAFAPRNQGLSEDKVELRVTEAMDLVRLPASFRERMPLALSGGERRRVAIAGVLALDPEFLILDEPTAGLDPRGREEIFEAVAKLYNEQKKSIILVSHNMDDILRLATRLVVMNNGELVADGEPRAVFGDKELIAGAGLLEPRLIKLENDFKSEGIMVGDTHNPQELAREIIHAK